VMNSCSRAGGVGAVRAQSPEPASESQRRRH
jgi:hypothetical protein